MQQSGLRLVSEARGDQLFAWSPLAYDISSGIHNASASRELLLAKRRQRIWRSQRFDRQSALGTTAAESEECLQCLQLIDFGWSIFRWQLCARISNYPTWSYWVPWSNSAMRLMKTWRLRSRLPAAWSKLQMIKASTDSTPLPSFAVLICLAIISCDWCLFISWARRLLLSFQ